MMSSTTPTPTPQIPNQFIPVPTTVTTTVMRRSLHSRVQYYNSVSSSPHGMQPHKSNSNSNSPNPRPHHIYTPQSNARTTLVQPHPPSPQIKQPTPPKHSHQHRRTNQPSRRSPLQTGLRNRVRNA